LILVTHGAGCNALIGALTNQPVLLDVGMASLTMAVRKPNVGDMRPKINQFSRKSRRGSIDLGIADDYTVELTASTEHLRAASNPLGTPSPRLDVSLFAANRRPSGSPFLEVREQSSMRFGMANNKHRSASGSHGLRPYHPVLPSRLSSGLWGSESIGSYSNISESSDSDSMPKFNRGAPIPRDDIGPTESRDAESEEPKPLAAATQTRAQMGLWSGSLVLQEDNSPKRRWTSAGD